MDTLGSLITWVMRIYLKAQRFYKMQESNDPPHTRLQCRGGRSSWENEQLCVLIDSTMSSTQPISNCRDVLVFLRRLFSPTQLGREILQTGTGFNLAFCARLVCLVYKLGGDVQTRSADLKHTRSAWYTPFHKQQVKAGSTLQWALVRYWIVSILYHFILTLYIISFLEL